MTRDERIAEMMPLVSRAANRFTIPAGVEAEDIVSAGVVAVVEAANEWDESRGVPWRAFATKKAQWAMIDELRHSVRRSDVNAMARTRAGEMSVPVTSDPAEIASARDALRTRSVTKIAESLPPPDEVAERVVRLRQVMYGQINEADVAAMMTAVMERAKAGNTGAAKLILEMLSPARGGTKVVQQAIVINNEDIG